MKLFTDITNFFKTAKQAGTMNDPLYRYYVVEYGQKEGPALYRQHVNKIGGKYYAHS